MIPTTPGINGGYSCKDGGTNTRTADWFNMLWDPSGGYMQLRMLNKYAPPVRIRYDNRDYLVKKDNRTPFTMWGNHRSAGEPN